MQVPLSWYLVLAAALFCIGLYAALSRRNAIGILMGVELMLNAANINFVAFWRYGGAETMEGLVFAVTVIALAAAEAAVALAIILTVYRRFKTVNVDQINLMRG